MTTGAAGLAGPLPAAHADGVRVPPTATTSGDLVTTLQVPVPRGVELHGVSGTLRVSGDDATGLLGEVVVGVVLPDGGRRVAASYAARPTQQVLVALRPADVDGTGLVTLTLRHQHPVVRDCGYLPPDVQVQLTDLVLRYGGVETAPRSVGRFLGPEVTGVDVVLDGQPSDAAVEAALSAVAELSADYPAPVPVRLLRRGDAPSRTSAGQRVVRIEDGPSPAVATVTTPTGGVPTLLLSGQGEELVGAARALGRREVGLAALPEAATLGVTPDTEEPAGGADADTDLRLADFTDSDVLTLGGWGVTRTYVGLPQDRFGGPVEELDVHLTGAHTAVSGYDARLDVLVNDEIVSSQMLDQEPGFDLDVTVPTELVHPDNGLELVLTAFPDCAGTAAGARGTDLPPRLDISTTRSAVLGVRGAGDVSGFGLFPQVLGHHLPVAVRDTAAGTDDQVQRAAEVVGALQRASTAPLTVDLLPPDSLLGSTESGLLVGATDADTDRLKAPLRLEQVRLIDFQESTFELGDDARYAALQVVPQGGRELLVLGGWTPDQPRLTGSLTAELTGQVANRGWRSLQHDLLVVTATHQPFDLSTRTLLAQETPLAESRGAAWWLAVGLGVLALVAALQAALAVRRRRAVDAVVRAHVAEESAPGA